MQRRHTVTAATAVTALVASIGAAQLLPGAVPAARAAGLVPFSDCPDLLAHYRAELRASATPYGFGDSGSPITLDGEVAVSSQAGGTARSGADATGPVGPGSTGTNLQEQGVDEPDLAKLRDGRLVVLARNRVQVLSAEAQPRLLGSLQLGGEQSYGGELLLVGDRALAVVPGMTIEPQEPEQGDDLRRSTYHPGTPTTRLLLLDLSTDQPHLLEEATYQAQYVSARLVDETVRLVTTTRPVVPAASIYVPGPAAERKSLATNQRSADALTLSDVLPQVVRRDAGGAVLERGDAVDCGDVSHARRPRGASTLLVTTLRPADGLASSDDTAVTTDGDLVYASEERLYVATSRWGTVGPIRAPAGTADSSAAPGEVTTELHGFDISSATSTSYLGSGSVPGYVLGRWALSSHEGALRVATTRAPPWDGERTEQTSSMVVKLAERDGALVETGRVEGLGKTEQIRAVRYVGDVAAVVTFRQTDPLYLLDLSGTPRVLGELKVPGFSTYLHPIGDGRLLGLGQDADPDGRITGVQVSVFDISDLSSPSLVDRLSLGHGYTPALDDSRAFSYDPDRRLAVLPFSGYHPDGTWQESTSALGIAVDSAGRLREVGRLPVDPATPPSRVLVDDDRVYAVGDGGVVAGEAASMLRTGALVFGG